MKRLGTSTFALICALACAHPTPDEVTPETCALGPQTEANDSPQERVDVVADWIEHCGTNAAATLTQKLIAHKTIRSAEDSKPAFSAMRDELSDYAQAAGLHFQNFGPDEVWRIRFAGTATSSIAHTTFVALLVPS